MTNAVVRAFEVIRCCLRFTVRCNIPPQITFIGVMVISFLFFASIGSLFGDSDAGFALVMLGVFGVFIPMNLWLLITMLDRFRDPE